MERKVCFKELARLVQNLQGGLTEGRVSVGVGRLLAGVQCSVEPLPLGLQASVRLPGSMNGPRGPAFLW